MSEMKAGQDHSDTGTPVPEGLTTEDQRKNRARRQILRSMVVGGGAMTAARAVPERWSRPIVDSVVLPGHAATSVAGGGAGNPVGNFTSGPIVVAQNHATTDALLAQNPGEAESISNELLEFFMPSAHAQAMCNAACKVVFTATVQNVAANICVTGDVNGYAACTLLPGDPPRLQINSQNSVHIVSGEFHGGSWRLALAALGFSNVSSNVTMTPGGEGCFPG